MLQICQIEKHTDYIKLILNGFLIYYSVLVSVIRVLTVIYSIFITKY